MITKAMITIIILTLSFNLLDFITGFTKACKTKSLNSKKMREGIFHKFGFILLYVLSILMQYANIMLKLGFPINLLYIVCTYVILTEIISIFENIGKINPKIDIKKLKDEIIK